MTSPTRFSFLLLVLAVLSSGCGGSGGGGPRSPTDPGSGVASIQGTWLGTATSLSASGTCLADSFQPLTVPARWVIQQQGATFTASQTLNNAITCPFRGSVSGSTVTFFSENGGPAACTLQTVACRSAPQRQLRMELTTSEVLLVGTVSGDRMTTSGASTWRVTDARTGQLVGNFVVRGAQELARQ
jgi:hypothetical protein